MTQTVNRADIVIAELCDIQPYDWLLRCVVVVFQCVVLPSVVLCYLMLFCVDVLLLCDTETCEFCGS